MPTTEDLLKYFLENRAWSAKAVSKDLDCSQKELMESIGTLYSSEEEYSSEKGVLFTTRGLSKLGCIKLRRQITSESIREGKEHVFGLFSPVPLATIPLVWVPQEYADATKSLLANHLEGIHFTRTLSCRPDEDQVVSTEEMVAFIKGPNSSPCSG